MPTDVRRFALLLVVPLSTLPAFAQGGTAQKATAGVPPPSSYYGNGSDAQYGTPAGQQQQPSYQVGNLQATFSGPGTLTNPAQDSDCDAITKKQDDQVNNIDSVHQKCLDQAQAAHQPPKDNGGDDMVCSQSSCQNLHVLWMNAKKYDSVAQANADACHQSYAAAQDAKRKAEEERQKQIEAAKERQEQQIADQKKRQTQINNARAKAQADADAKAEAQREALQRRQDILNQDQQNLQQAQGVSQANQAALAERNAERDAQIQGLQGDVDAANASVDGNLAAAQQQVASLDAKVAGDPANPLGTATTTDDGGLGDYALPPPKTADAANTAPNPAPDTTPASDVPYNFPPPSDTSEIVPADPDIAASMRRMDDPPETIAEAPQVESETLNPNPDPSVMSRINDGLSSSYDYAKDKIADAKATIGDALNSPTAQHFRAVNDISNGDTSAPLATDSPEVQEQKVSGGVALGLIKYAIVPTPKMLYDTMSRNVSNVTAQLSNYFSSFNSSDNSNGSSDSQ